MPSLRSGLPDLTKNVFDDWSWFLKAVVGGTTYRWTDQARNTVDGFIGNIDGTSQTWSERYLIIPQVSFDSSGARMVNYFQMDNVDYVPSGLANSPGLRGSPFELWLAYFLADGVTIDGTPQKITAGSLDDSSHKLISQVTMKPLSTSWGRLAIGPPNGPLCPYIFKDPDTCQYVGANTNCDKTRTDCTTNKLNQVHFGGNDLSPAAGTKVTWQYQEIDPSSASVQSPPPPPPTPDPVTTPPPTHRRAVGGPPPANTPPPSPPPPPPPPRTYIPTIQPVPNPVAPVVPRDPRDKDKTR